MQEVSGRSFRYLMGYLDKPYNYLLHLRSKCLMYMLHYRQQGASP
jgi:hypothetical protein